MNPEAMIRRTLVLALAAAFALPVSAAAAVTVAADVNCVDLPANLSVGSTGGAVSALQAFLRDAGFLDAEPTGYFGNLTREAVAVFQGGKDISPADGVAGPTTRAAIRRQSCSRGAAAITNAAASGSTGPNTVTVNGVTFDLTPVPNRKSTPKSGTSASPASKLKILLKTSLEKGAKGEGQLEVSVGARSTNSQVEIWELSVDCNRGASALAGSRELCGQTVSKYAYALAAPEDGFVLLRADLRNSLAKRVSVNLTLSALDAEGNVMASEPARVRIAAGPAAKK